MPINLDRVCVFVDGANFRYLLSEVLGAEFDPNDTPLPASDRWLAVFRELAKQAAYAATGDAITFLRALWYVPDGLEDPASAALESQWKARKQAQEAIERSTSQIKFVRAGRMVPVKGGATKAREKGVDVMLAVDMVTLADTYSVAVLVTRDGDLVPAIEAVQRMGRHVVLPVWKNKESEPLPGYSPALLRAVDVQLPHAGSWLADMVRHS